MDSNYKLQNFIDFKNRKFLLEEIWLKWANILIMEDVTADIEVKGK